MRKMFSKKQIQNMTLNYIEGFDEIELDGDLIVNGDIKGLENIVDSEGHKRFIEGEITTNATSGVTYLYKRWSLSGTHLMIVLSLKIDSGTTLGSYAVLGDIAIPEWVYNKCIPIGDSESNWIMLKRIEILDKDGNFTNEQSNFLLNKVDDPKKLRIYSINSITASADDYIRVEFDLLIDNSQA